VRIDMPALGGILFGVMALVLGFVLEGGKAGALLQGTAALIVFGGTLGATMVSYSVDELRQIPRLFKMALTRDPFDPVGLIRELARYADIARKQQTLALEPEIQEATDPFVQKGLQMIVDNTDPDLMRQIMEADMYALLSQQRTGASIFEQAGGYAPTMGIVGTIMGLVHVLGELSGSPNQLASAIGLAFIATLYGVSSANLFWLPLANNLKNKAKQETLIHQIALEGFLSINQGMPPSTLTDKLMSFISPSGSSGRGESQSPGGGVEAAS
jgi:chemotaxis protein MotA